MTEPLPACLQDLSEEALAQMAGTRNIAQFAEMLKKLKAGVCNFCQEHLDRTINKVLFQNEHWMVWECPPRYMRPELGLHILVVPVRHVNFPWELTDDEFRAEAEVWRFIQRGCGDKIPGGGIITRIGDMRWNAGTVAHLHKNLWVPNGTAEVRTPFFKVDEHAADNRKRMLRFAKEYEAAQQQSV